MNNTDVFEKLGGLNQNLGIEGDFTELENILESVSKGRTNEKIFGDIREELGELYEEIDLITNMDDLSGQSVYIESEIGDVIFNILKAYSQKVGKNISVEGIFSGMIQKTIGKTRESLGEMNQYIRYLEAYSDYYMSDVDEIMGYMILLYNELLDKGYLQQSIGSIVSEIGKKFERRYRNIVRGDLTQEERENNYIWWEGCKDLENREKKNELDKRRGVYRSQSTIDNVIAIMGVNNITVDSVDSLVDIDENSTIIVLQKFAEEEVILMLERMGLYATFGRKGFLSISLENGEKIFFIKTKDIDSMEGFSDIEDCVKDVFYIGGSDMVQKYQSINGKESLVNLEKIDGELFFGTKTQLLPLVDKQSADMIISGGLPQTVATKFKAIISEEAIKELGEIKKMYSIDSNSEALLQILRLKYPGITITGIEIVQSGASVFDTSNYIIREENGDIIIYEPSVRKPGSDFTQDSIYATISQPRQKLLNFVKRVQTDIDVELCKINKTTKNDLEKILNPSENSIQDFLIRIMKLRGEELLKFERIELR